MKTIAMAAAIAIVAAGGAAGMVIGGAGAQIAKTYTVVASNTHSATVDIDRAAAISPVANDATPGAAPLAAEPAVSAPEPAPAPHSGAASNLNMTTHVIPAQSVPALAPRTSLPRAHAVQTAVQAPAQPATQQPALRLVPPPVAAAPQSGTHSVTRPPATTVAHANTPAANDAAHQAPAAATRTRNGRRTRQPTPPAPQQAALPPAHVETTPAPMIIQTHTAPPASDATHATTLSETHSAPAQTQPATEPAPQPPAAAPSPSASPPAAQPATTPAPGPAATNSQDSERHGLAAILFGSP